MYYDNSRPRPPLPPPSRPNLNNNQLYGWGLPQRSSTTTYSRPPQPIQSRVTETLNNPSTLSNVTDIDSNDDNVRLSSEEAQKQLSELMEGVTADMDDVDLSNTIDKVEGMNQIKLLNHQIQGIAWMKDRESGKKNKFGGILADDMGLGKTIQTLATILTNPPSNDKIINEFGKTTLIVAPLAVVSQWESEARNKCQKVKVLTHHGPSRARDPSKFDNYDIIVTSYQTITSEHKIYVEEMSEKLDKDDNNKSKKKQSSKKPLCALFQATFYRIVLDEAQNIKGRTSKMSVGCAALKSRLRWCLTGTPIQNNVDELFALLRFLKIQPFSDWDEFKYRIIVPLKNGRAKVALKRLQLILKSIMLRRTKESQNDDGSPLLKLPPRYVKEILCDFDDDERKFYDAIHNRAEQEISKYVKDGSVNSRYTSVLTMLLRLRQACCHPQLVLKSYTSDDFVNNDQALNDKDDDDDLADMFAGMGVNNDTNVDNVLNINKGSKGRNILNKGIEDSAKIREIMKILKDIHNSPYISNHNNKEDLESLNKNNSNQNITSKTEKTDKVKKDDNAGISSKAIVISDSEDDDIDTIIKRTASMDLAKKKNKKNNKIVISSSSEDDNDDENENSDDSEDSKKEKQKVDSSNKSIVQQKFSINQVNQKPEKTIVFSQFTSFLDIIEAFMKKAKYKYVRYDGSMRPAEREYVLNKIRTDDETTIILISFKAGSTGLNLNACSRVILADMWWNPALEDQAFDRAHRLGQQRDVHIYKLTVPKTVEDRILELQKKKRDLAESALSGKAISNKLGLTEVLDLFKRDDHHDEE